MRTNKLQIQIFGGQLDVEMSKSTSAEPMRRTAYSNDLRWRVVWQRLALDLKYQRIAENLSISVGTVHNVWQLFQDTGEVDPRKRPKSEHKLDNYHSLYIIGLIAAYPALKLSEITKYVEEISGSVVSTSTICRLLANHGFTRKKIQHIALQRRVDFRGSFIANVSLFKKEMFVFVDETGSNLKSMLRQYGYALCGERAVSKKLVVRGQRINSIAAICTEGVLAVDIRTSSVNGENFYDFVRGDLLPEMLPFDGSNPRSILILDNCSIHHVEELIDLLNYSGILLLFLPPYSPDLNPIELTFSYIKQYLKDHEDIMHIVPMTYIVKSSYNSVSGNMCDAWIKHCGY